MSSKKFLESASGFIIDLRRGPQKVPLESIKIGSGRGSGRGRGLGGGVGLCEKI